LVTAFLLVDEYEETKRLAGLEPYGDSQERPLALPEADFETACSASNSGTVK
jgi:hypothetical protein